MSRQLQQKKHTASFHQETIGDRDSAISNMLERILPQGQAESERIVLARYHASAVIDDDRAN